MAKIVLSFIILSFIFYFGITAVRSMSGKEKWALTKTVAYSTIVALLAVLVMMVIVILF
jgi:hypothetical protein